MIEMETETTVIKAWLGGWLGGSIEERWNQILEEIKIYQECADNIESPYELEMTSDCILLVENHDSREEVWMFRKGKEKIYFEYRGKNPGILGIYLIRDVLFSDFFKKRDKR